ncbi:TonB-dependent receptor [Ravibacter arvi]|uniref:TonB-dependent receptor n=2 Tax=Ravibacter arvi TaxID=2051041 RepID=A0ABP8LUC4_9BACT
MPGMHHHPRQITPPESIRLSLFEKKETGEYYVKSSKIQPDKGMEKPRKLITRWGILMKISVLQLFIGFVTAAYTYGHEAKAQELLARPVTVHFVSVDIKTALAEVEKKANVKFVYTSRLVPLKRKVTLKVVNKSVSETLDALFEPDRVKYSIVRDRILISVEEPGSTLETPLRSMSDPAAEKQVKGRVTDEKGDGLPGVNIVVKGSQRGTISNVDGAFEISVPEGFAALTFSFVGYESQEIEVGSRTFVEVALKVDQKSLEEVVVVGYSSKNMSELSSAVSVINADKLKGVTTPSLGNMLQGKAPGVIVSSASGQPGAAPAVRIRGTGTISASADPLYVVDGVIGGTANPNDIESVTVLKDAAATGLYGSRAANGVIVITTKTGKAGKTKINLNTAIGSSSVLRGKFRMMNSRQYYDYSLPMYTADYDGKRASYIADLQKTNPNPTDAQIQAWLESKKFPTTLDGYLNINFPSSLLDHDTDWSDLVYRNGLTQNYELSASGGNEKTRFYVSGNYYDEEGNMTNSDYKRFNVRMNLSHQINDKLSISGRVNGKMDYTTFDYSGERGGAWTTFYNLPTDYPYNPDGSVRVGTEPDWFGRDRFNFLFPMQYNYSLARSTGVQGDFVLNYAINDFLSFSSTNRADLGNTRSEIYDDPRTLTGGIRNGLLTNGTGYSQSLLNSNLLKANKNWGQHTLSGLIGMEFQSNYGENVLSSGGGVPAGLGILDVAAVPVSVGGNKYKSNFNSYFSQADYSFADRYFLTASVRRDGSSKFGNRNQYGNFWALGGSWILSNEKFLAGNSTITFLKFRGSYGTTGNANITDFVTRGLYSFSQQYAGISAAIPARLSNPDLTWEKAYITNLGFNLGLFNRITLALDLYQRDTKNLLFDVPLSSAAGFSTQIQNVGFIRNKGIELDVTSVNFSSGGFSWETNFNIGFNRNRVMELYKNQDIDLGVRRVIVGKPLGTWYMQKWMGVDAQTGSPLWEKLTYDESGAVVKKENTSNYNEATRQVVGKSIPDFTGGFNNSLQYKGISLDFLFSFVSGADVYESLRENLGADGAYPTVNSVVLRPGESYWKNPGDQATHPKAILGGNLNSSKASSRFLLDASYIRLRNVRLAYQFPEAILKRLGLGQLSVYGTGDNLLTWTPYTGMDPEVGFEAGATGLAKYFNSRKLLFGINIGF